MEDYVEHAVVQGNVEQEVEGYVEQEVESYVEQAGVVRDLAAALRSV